MVRVWMMDDSTADQREPHMTEPPVFVTLEDLFKRTGVEYMKFPVEGLETNEEFLKLKEDRGYTYEDVMEVSRDTLPNYEVKIKSFFTEHLHADEEIRFVAAGSGYFDVRDKEDKWMRVELCPGDMIVLPSGIYHRFTLDTNNYIKAKRLFIGDPVWTPINRPADDHPERKNYLKSMALEA